MPTAHSHIAGGSVVDSVTAPVAMGLSFNYVAWDPDGVDRNEYDVRLSAAYYIARILSIGLSLKYVYANQDGHGPLATNLFQANGDEQLNTVTVDVGTTLTIGQIFSAAVVGYNLTNTGSQHAPLSLGIGLALTIRAFVVATDVLLDFTSAEDLMVRAMGGAEYLVNDNWPIRLGYRWDQLLGTHAVTGGFGYVSQRFGVELSLRQDVSSPDDHLHTSLVLAIRYFAN
jgi:opacity protein-like surface antigen